MMYFKTSSLKIIRKPTAVSWPAANSCHLLDVSQSPFTAADKPRDLSSHPEVAEASGSLTWAYITVTRRAGYDTDGWGPTPEFLLHFIWAGTHWFAFLTFHSLLSPFVLVTTLWEPPCWGANKDRRCQQGQMVSAGSALHRQPMISTKRWKKKELKVYKLKAISELLPFPSTDIKTRLFGMTTWKKNPCWQPPSRVRSHCQKLWESLSPTTKAKHFS